MDRGIVFTPSPSTDVVAYRIALFLQPSDTPAGTKDVPIAELVPDPVDSTKVRFDVAADPAFPNLDGLYRAEVRAIDDAGNTSPPLEGTLTIDAVPPDAPTNFGTF